MALSAPMIIPIYALYKIITNTGSLRDVRKF